MVCHGDDFTALGCNDDLDWYEQGLEKAFELGEKIRMGEDDGLAKEARILNRVLRLDSRGLRFEADPRHSENLRQSLGLSSCKPIGTPGVKAAIPTHQEEEEEMPAKDETDDGAHDDETALDNMVDSFLERIPSIRIKKDEHRCV